MESQWYFVGLVKFVENRDVGDTASVLAVEMFLAEVLEGVSRNHQLSNKASKRQLQKYVLLSEEPHHSAFNFFLQVLGTQSW